MAEVKQSLLTLLKLLAHSVMTAIFVIAIAAAGTATTFALASICGGTNHVLCYAIWLALELPFLLGIVFVVATQVLHQTDEFFSTLRTALKSIARALKGIRRELSDRGRKRYTRKRITRTTLPKAIGPAVSDAVVQLKNTDDEAA